MLTDCRDLTAGTTLSADVCIVGGGPAGIVLALEIARLGSAAVLLVESGGFSAEPANDDLNVGEAVGNFVTGSPKHPPPGLDGVRARVIGGATSKWGGYCRTLRPIDFEARPYQPVGGWPIGAADLDPWYPAAHDLCHLGPVNYDTAYWAAQAGVATPFGGVPDLQPAAIQRSPVRFGNEYQSALQSSTTITLLHHANVTALHSTAGGGHVQHVTIRTLTGVEVTANASVFVVATGGIEVARLLLSSDDQVAAGLGNQHDQVGRYFADHIGSSHAVLLLHNTVEELALYSAPGVSVSTASPDGSPTNVVVQGCIEMSDDLRRSEGLPGVRFDLVAGPLVPTPSITQTHGTTFADVASLVGAGTAPGTTVALARGYTEAVLDPGSRVTLTNTTDALGMRRVRVDWQCPPSQQQLMRTGFSRLGEILGGHGLGRLQASFGWTTLSASGLSIDPTGDEMTFVPMETSFHHLCTARMSTDPYTGVVDIHGRVHTTDNLFVAGSAVFPAPSGDFPTLTIVALALRLANHLVEDVLP